MTKIKEERQDTQEVHSPIDKGKKNIDEIFEDYSKPLSVLTFMSNYSFKNKPDEYCLPKANKFFCQKWNKTYMAELKKGKITVSLKANFVITDVKECTHHYNDKSNKNSSNYYIVTLKNANGKIERDVEMMNVSKSDYKQFQADLSNRYNDFALNMTGSEYKTFVAEFISPKVASKVTIYSNAGVLEEGKILYSNALATKDGVIWADDNGYIKTGENTFIRLAEATHYLPKLFCCDKSGQQIAKELMTNIKECWSENIVPPLLTLGHMVMAIYFDYFIQRFGVPTLILYGDSGSGKSTLVVVGLSIFGLSKDGLTSGGSTAKSNEFLTAHYNCMNIAIDDVKGETLKSGNFIALIKGAYKAITRTRMLPYGRGIENINICSPLAYSTNESLPELKEVINRLNVIELFGTKFKADKFKYHEFDKNNSNNLKELSLILPEFLKISKSEVIETYEQAFDLLISNVEDTQNRIINNIAYAYTGAMILSFISGVEFENLQEQVIAFAKNQIEKYENIKTPVEKVLAGIITLTELGQLEIDMQFKIVDANVEGKKEKHIRFSKEVILSAINKFYAYDKTMKIDEKSFLSFAKNHKRFRGNGHGVRYADNKNRVVSSICFDISDMDEFADITGCNGSDSTSEINCMSYEDLTQSVEKQKGNNT